MPSLTIIILTYNEERHLARALSHIADIATEVLIIDSYSKDRTVAIAEKWGARVLQNPFINYAKQFQWGLDNGGITTDWIMRLDADEVIETDLAAEIKAKLPVLPADVSGVNLDRKHIFMGRWIRRGGRYPIRLLRIWRNGMAHIEDRWMDEHMVLSAGSSVTFKGGFADFNLNDLTFFIDKHNKYATREAIDVLNQQYDLFPWNIAMSSRTGPFQASVKRFIKERIYNRIPFQISALAYFLYRYFFQLGFLDGIEGLIYHVLQGGWYRFLVGAKVLELRRAIAAISDPKEKIEILSKLTGHKF